MNKRADKSSWQFECRTVSFCFNCKLNDINKALNNSR